MIRKTNSIYRIDLREGCVRVATVNNAAPIVSTGTTRRLELDYPNGWFQVAYADDLSVGEVVKMRYFGQELVLFRTESGEAQVLDAYCAHLGSHLGVGGVVAGECIRCPFHAWAYGTDGVCREIPYAAR